MPVSKTISFAVEMDLDCAEALARLLRELEWQRLRAMAQCDMDADLMRLALLRLRLALLDAGLPKTLLLPAADGEGI